MLAGVCADAPVLPLRGFVGVPFRQVIDEFAGCDIERRGDVHESQRAGIALPVFDVDETSKAHPLRSASSSRV